MGRMQGPQQHPLVMFVLMTDSCSLHPCYRAIHTPARGPNTVVKLIKEEEDPEVESIPKHDKNEEGVHLTNGSTGPSFCSALTETAAGSDTWGGGVD